MSNINKMVFEALDSEENINTIRKVISAPASVDGQLRKSTGSFGGVKKALGGIATKLRDKEPFNEKLTKISDAVSTSPPEPVSSSEPASAPGDDPVTNTNTNAPPSATPTTTPTPTQTQESPMLSDVEKDVKKKISLDGVKNQVMKAFKK